MESRRQNVSEDRQIILRRHTQSSTSINGESIPTDLIIEILSRLSTKSVAICRCVSKLWASILRLPDFTDSFLTRSSSRPLMLFACQEDGEFVYYSSPQPQNPDENSSSLAVSYHMKFPYDRVTDVCRPVSGLVCLRHERVLKGRINPVSELVICNPSTRQSFTLPKMKTRSLILVRSFFGYDPIEKQFKVLSMAFGYRKGKDISKDHQVLTLGTEKKLSWRMIECGIRHYPRRDGICIDGVLYYKAGVNCVSNGEMIICFHVRSEKFSVVKVTEPFIRAVCRGATLINYNGKLASLSADEFYPFGARNGSFALFVLENPEKQEWSKHIYKLPNVLAHRCLKFAGVTGSNEIVFSPSGSWNAGNTLYVFYYNIERKTLRRFETLRMEAFMKHVDIFPDHVEDVKVMQWF